MSCSERKRELRRRRHRRKKVNLLARKLKKATVSERSVIAEKLRALTPGGETIVLRLGTGKTVTAIRPGTLPDRPKRGPSSGRRASRRCRWVIVAGTSRSG